MKKLKLNNRVLFPFLIFLLLTTIYSCHVPNAELTSTAEVGMKFGKGDICIGSGICIMEAPDEFHETEYDALGELIYEDGKVIELQIKKSSISEAKSKEQFGASTFEIQKDIDFESEKGVLSKGQYLVSENEEFIILSIGNNQ